MSGVRIILILGVMGLIGILVLFVVEYVNVMFEYFVFEIDIFMGG